MLDLIEEKTILDNCANFLDKALKEAKTPADLFLPQALDSMTSGGVLHDLHSLAEEQKTKQLEKLNLNLRSFQ